MAFWRKDLKDFICFCFEHSICAMTNHFTTDFRFIYFASPMLGIKNSCRSWDTRRRGEIEICQIRAIWKLYKLANVFNIALRSICLGSLLLFFLVSSSRNLVFSSTMTWAMYQFMCIAPSIIIIIDEKEPKVFSCQYLPKLAMYFQCNQSWQRRCLLQ